MNRAGPACVIRSAEPVGKKYFFISASFPSRQHCAKSGSESWSSERSRSRAALRFPPTLRKSRSSGITISRHGNFHLNPIPELARNFLRRTSKLTMLACLGVLPFDKQLAAVLLVTG
jgi:hypothetical protein